MCRLLRLRPPCTRRRSAEPAREPEQSLKANRQALQSTTILLFPDTVLLRLLRRGRIRARLLAEHRLIAMWSPSMAPISITWRRERRISTRCRPECRMSESYTRGALAHYDTRELRDGLRAPCSSCHRIIRGTCRRPPENRQPDFAIQLRLSAVPEKAASSRSLKRSWKLLSPMMCR